MVSLVPPAERVLSNPTVLSRTTPAQPPTISAEDKSERFVLRTITATLVVAVVTQKVAIPIVPGKIALQITLLIQYGMILALLLGGRIKLSLGKLALFLTFSSAAVLVHILQAKEDFSLPSLVYVILIYSTYIYVVPIRQETFTRYLMNFQIVAVCACIMVFMDWACQFAHLGMPSIEYFIPKSFIFFNYVYIQPLEWGARYLKPNGFFFLETSYVSQFIAFGLIIEICLFQRIRFLGALALGQVCSFGGTGMTLVLLSIPVVLFYFRLKLLPLILIAAPIAGITAIQIGLVDNIIMRSQEFSQEGSSGNQRFTVQAERVAEVLRGDTRDALIGIGAGQMPQYLNMMWTPVSKVLVEYGVIVYALFWTFLLFCMFGRGVPFVISWMALMQYVFLNGSFLVPINSFYNVMLAALLIVRKPKPPSASYSGSEAALG
ncbi:hypothetical protein [Rhizorhabdus argentea]|uniref:hypothetical protein n=1 Tax=Rhizorhabdus argentea TaxID=1387174 RepID=UPI0030EC86D6